MYPYNANTWPTSSQWTVLNIYYKVEDLNYMAINPINKEIMTKKIWIANNLEVLQHFNITFILETVNLNNTTLQLVKCKPNQ